jgi:hypothetical protein
VPGEEVYLSFHAPSSSLDAIGASGPGSRSKR